MQQRSSRVKGHGYKGVGAGVTMVMDEDGNHTTVIRITNTRKTHSTTEERKKIAP